MTSASLNMMKHLKLLCICIAFSQTVLCYAQTAAQNEVFIAPETLNLGSTSSTVEIESQPTFEVPAEMGFDPNVPIIIECADEAGGGEQCVVVKKSILGCMEGITVLPQDEIWFMNARECDGAETDLCRLKVSKLVGSDLVERDLSQLTAAHASGDEFTTVLYIHGNQTNEEFAMARGLQVYRNAFATKAHLRGPVRYVIWAWKSEQERVRFYPDYLVKSDRSVQLGETFAATLNQFSDRNMVVFGFSLGVQVVLSAFDSPQLDPREGDPTRYQVAFAAPAINSKFVACHSLKAFGVTPVQQTLVFTNRKDRAIRAAQLIIRRETSTKEATIAGLSDAGKLNIGAVTAIDVFEESGRFHSIERYTRSGTLQTMMANLVNEVASMKSSPNATTSNGISDIEFIQQ